MFSPGGTFKPRYRYSNRQPTKRQWKIVTSLSSASSSSPSHIDQTSQKSSVKISPIAQYVVASPFRVPANVSHQQLAERSRSSPLAQLVEEDENVHPAEKESGHEIGLPVAVSGQKRKTSSKKKFPSPERDLDQLQTAQVTPVNEGVPGDVSVTFLASTPKPGRKQMARKSKSGSSKLNRQTSLVKLSGRSDLVEEMSVEESASPVKIPRVLRSSDSKSASYLKQKKTTDSFITPQIPHASKVRSVQNKRQTEKVTNKLSRMIVNEVSTSSLTKQKSASKSHERREPSNSMISSSRLTSQSNASSIRTTDNSTGRSMSIISDSGSLPSSQSVLMWKGENMKRNKQDLLDLDVVLHAVSDLCASELDLCESSEEKKAVRCLKQYFTESITSMIREAQSVRTCQAKIKQQNTSLKRKKERLFSLQRERLLSEGLSIAVTEKSQHTENMIEINTFLSELKDVVKKC